MRKIVLIYGLIAGAVVSGMLVISQPLLRQGIINYENGMIVGYTSMVIALSVIFFAVKTFRDQYGDGKISFGTAFKIGMLITLVASILYASTWEVYYNTAGRDFMEQFNAYHLEKMRKQGASETEMTTAKQKMDAFSETYKNPFIRFGLTMLEISPVGVVISLLCAALLRRKEIVPQSA